jgi:hypothetical protein
MLPARNRLLGKFVNQKETRRKLARTQTYDSVSSRSSSDLGAVPLYS